MVRAATRIGLGALAAAWIGAVSAAPIQFDGRTWNVRDWGQGGEPGPNYWSTNSVWVDAAGSLHIAITAAGGTNYCGEVVSTNSFGYGDYYWFVSNRMDLIADHAVAGLFTYQDPWGVNEIDIEFTRVFDAGNTSNLVYSVQPYYQPGHQTMLQRAFTNGPTTHAFSWAPGRVRWRSWEGHSQSPTPTNPLIAEKFFEGEAVPLHSAEKVYMNLWLEDGEAPSNGITEMVVQRFLHEPMGSSVLFTDEFADVAMDARWTQTGVNAPGGLAETNGVLRLEPSDQDYGLVGYRTADAIPLDFYKADAVVSVSLRAADLVRASTQAWAAGQSVQGIAALVSGVVWYDPWSASNAASLRCSYDTNDALTVELLTKTNALNAWGTQRFSGRVDGVSAYDDDSGVTLELRLGISNYWLKVLRGTNALPLQAVSGSVTGAHGLGTALASSHFVLAAAHVADGRGVVSWNRASGAFWFATNAPETEPEAPAAPNEAEVTDTNKTAVWRYPLETLRTRMRCQSLFTAAEIGRSGALTGLALQVVSAPGISLTNYVIRLQHTTATTIPAAWVQTGWSTALVAFVQNVSTGWHYFAFRQPFAYNGTNNLLVDFSLNNTRREASPLGYVRRVARSANRTRVGSASSGNPLTWSSPAGLVMPDVPGVRFVFEVTNSPPTGPVNLLKNPAFELGPAGEDGVPTNWWTEGNAAAFSWAGVTGTAGVAFKNWSALASGRLGQEVAVSSSNGNVFLFSLRASRDPHFASASSSLWMRLAVVEGATTQAVAHRSVYGELMAAPAYTWTLLSLGCTNRWRTNSLVQVSVGFDDGLGDLSGERTVKWDEASLVQTNGDPRDNSVQGVSLDWMLAHALVTGAVTVAEREGLDHDGDGMATWEEFVAGTVPTSAASRFLFSGVSLAGNAVVLEWPSVSNRLYHLSWSAQPGDGPESVGTAAAIPPMNSHTLTVDAASAVWRVEAGFGP